MAPAQVLEAVFPGLREAERAAATARRRIENGPAAHFYVRGSGLSPTADLQFARCCQPVPGDRIVGIMQGRKGVMVHAIDCPKLAEYEDREELWRDLQWTPEAERETLSVSSLHATILDAPGVLGQACAIIGEAGGNIVRLSMDHRHSSFFDADIDIEVKDARHLTHIAAALRACPSVETVERARGWIRIYCIVWRHV